MTTPENPTAHCVECGALFAVDDMIRHETAYVCATCKPRFLQKLVEGADVKTGMRYAKFRTRFGAVFIDGLILGLANFILPLLVTWALPNAVAVTILTLLIQVATGLTYETYLLGTYGATVGKMACKIKVVNADGSSISFGRALARYFCKYYLNIFTLGIGYFIAAFDAQGRSLHDRICNTRVVME